MTATTRSDERNTPGATLMLAFHLGSTKWTLEESICGAASAGSLAGEEPAPAELVRRAADVLRSRGA